MDITASGDYNNVDYIKIRGIRPALVFISGLNSDPEQWEEVIKRLNTRREIWLLSPPRYGKYTLPDIADDIRKFFMKQWLLKPYIIGHSLGGLATLEMLRQGQKARGVMIMSAPSFEYTPELLKQEFHAAHKLLHKSGLGATKAIELLLQIHPTARDMLSRASVQSYFDAYVDFVDNKASLKLPEEVAKKVHKRIGVYGMKDYALQMTNGYTPEEYYPTELVEIPDGRHSIQTEKPKIIADLIRKNFL